MNEDSTLENQYSLDLGETASSEEDIVSDIQLPEFPNSQCLFSTQCMCTEKSALLEAVPVVSLQNLKHFLMEKDCLKIPLILKYRKELSILFINSIFNDQLLVQDITKAANFITLDCLHDDSDKEGTITELENFLSDIISFHNKASMYSDSNKSNYFQILFSIVSEKYDTDFEELLDSISKLIVEIEKSQPKVQEENIHPSTSHPKTQVGDDTLSKVRSSLARAEQHLKRTRDEFEAERHLFVENFVKTNSPHVSISENHHTTDLTLNECHDNSFLFPFRGDVLRLNRNRFPALFEHEKEQENIIKHDITGIPSHEFSTDSENSTQTFTSEQTLWFSVQYQIFHQYLSKNLTPPQHLLRSLEYFKEMHELKRITSSKESMNQFNVYTERKDFSILKDMVYVDSQHNMTMMHPYVHSYYYYYYSKLFKNHFMGDNEEQDLAIFNDPLHKLVPPRKKINRYAFGKQFSRNLAKKHAEQSSTRHNTNICPEEYGFPFRAPDLTSSPVVSICSSSDSPTTIFTLHQLNNNDTSNK
ncbi:hypothetical protein C9374_001146 [Naegleria lovaniensis]|uniref:Uncharacterized protein n=1 Tax=Naegleria lovaniensis TaxID=51637 RepID=A0AA88KRV2_NAELO|nr:uncharacterized protein C9374_001146 [Naegleria lovaniensis]KAG2387552.1 hypothetical protein C9374_001146 [Naegleria lovaniensis]